MRTFVRNNSLGLAALVLFALSLGGQIVTGHAEANDDRAAHNEPTIGLSSYLGSGHFIEAVFENWESEFLQMAAFVVLTVHLRQKGSPESKPVEGSQPVDAEPDPRRRRAPWPVRKGGWILKLYENSLGLTLFAPLPHDGLASRAVDRLAWYAGSPATARRGEEGDHRNWCGTRQAVARGNARLVDPKTAATDGAAVMNGAP